MTNSNCTTTTQSGLNRNFYNLNRKFIQFLIPATITNIAGSLDGFADGIVVSNLIGCDALNIINLANPILCIYAIIFILLGNGGSSIFAIYLGNHDRKNANKVFTMAIVCSLILSILVVIIGELIAVPLSNFITRGTGLEDQFLTYLRVLLLSSPFIIVTLTFAFFLPAAGHPTFATIINIVANVFNIICDYMFIKFFNAGVESAAWASVAGYLIAIIMVITMMLTGKCSLKFERICLNDFKELKNVVFTGAASASSQVGYTIKVAFCNLMAATYAGAVGVTAFSLCFQVISVISIFLGGTLESAIPFIATMKGMHDSNGMKHIIRRASDLILASSVIILLIVEIWPQILLDIYSVNEPDIAAIAIPAIRIFSWIILFRWIYILFMNLASVMGRQTYAFIIGMTDGFVVIIILGLILCPIMGITGLWVSYLLTSVIILIIVCIINTVIVVRSGGSIKGFWLIPADDNVIADFTVFDRTSDLKSISHSMEQIYRSNGMKMCKSMIISISMEEMFVITLDNDNGRECPMDVLLRIDDHNFVIDFRSIGKPFNPAAFGTNARDSLHMLRSISTEITYEYVLGINSTRIVCDYRD